jgi:hypothetical protein
VVDNLVDITCTALRQLQSMNARVGFQLEVTYKASVLFNGIFKHPYPN